MRRKIVITAGFNFSAILVCLFLFCSGCRSAAPTSTGNHSTVTTAALPATLPGATEDVQKAAAEPSSPFEGEGWRSLFSGTDLGGWEEVGYGQKGGLEIASGLLVLNMGEPFAGAHYTNNFPVQNYEIALDAMRLMGSDFFCGLTVPVGEGHCSLILGGWGGSLVGISSINGMDASENETTSFINFEKGHWYRVRMRVTPDRLQAWVDKDQVADVPVRSKLLTLRPGEIELCKPLGIATYQTMGAFREIKWRPLQKGSK